jgi:hypothetical protein
VADLIRQATGVGPELIVGARGEFTVWVGQQVVSRKGPSGFPSDDEALAAVQKALRGSH